MLKAAEKVTVKSTKLIRCSKCTRLLAIADGDGTVHIKNGRQGTEVILNAVSGKVHLICPAEYFITRKERAQRVSCGNRTSIVYEDGQCLITP